ncbi:uncharacterized protein PHACADRAFT_265868 [Phanerochaete carnosa HHB-10118-sp]|uniref:Uncharacterized protein n=1 Tax=Phanerochaete carnosa (strain HHB-10118-sp) TaxID=650164 RepID=K5VQQ1_PHACS|nr:uncharacterized protein PHACADRAFT_265868 [Phanerochaete carnosa HHB-10118-sp]EKM49070.1 hypothetical protein PHACADRAFT_265868 [Phanerochaete carnosa HHB-10118-sp]
MHDHLNKQLITSPTINHVVSTPDTGALAREHHRLADGRDKRRVVAARVHQRGVDAPDAAARAVIVSPAVHQAYTTYRPSTNTPLLVSFNSISPCMQISSLFPHDASPSSPSPRLRSLPLPLPPALPSPSSSSPDRAEAYTFTHPSLNIYFADLLSAARHYPLLDSRLLTLRAHCDATVLVRTYRMLCGCSLGAELIASVAAAAPSKDTSEDDDELRTAHANVHLWNDDGGDGKDAWLGAKIHAGHRKMGSVRSVEVHVKGPDVDAGPIMPPLVAHTTGHHTPRTAAFASHDSFAPSSLMAPLPSAPEVWDVSEIDAERVFPRAGDRQVDQWATSGRPVDDQ